MQNAEEQSVFKIGRLVTYTCLDGSDDNSVITMDLGKWNSAVFGKAKWSAEGSMWPEVLSMQWYGADMGQNVGIG